MEVRGLEPKEAVKLAGYAVENLVLRSLDYAVERLRGGGWSHFEPPPPPFEEFKEEEEDESTQ